MFALTLAFSTTSAATSASQVGNKVTYPLHHVRVVFLNIGGRAEPHASVVLQVLDALPKHVFIYVGRMSHTPVVMGVWIQSTYRGCPLGTAQNPLPSADVRTAAVDEECLCRPSPASSPPFASRPRRGERHMLGTEPEVGLTCL